MKKAQPMTSGTKIVGRGSRVVSGMSLVAFSLGYSAFI
jgi:hypothetical protein